MANAKSFQVKTIFSAVDKMSPSLSKMFKSITSQVALGTLAAKGISKAFAGIGNSLKSIPQWASGTDQILKDANKLGVESETLQRFRYAALHANVEASKLDAALLTMTKNIGTGALYKSLEKIDGGLSKQIKGAGTVEEAFRIVAKAMKGEQDAGKRAAIGTAVFGKSFADLIPMFDDLEETMRKAGRYGFIIPKEASQRANDFNTSITNLKTSLGFFQNLASDLLIKFVTPLVDKFLEWTVQNRELVSTKLAEFIFGVAGGIQWMINKIPDFIDTVKGFIEFVKREILPTVLWLVAKIPDLARFIGDIAPAIITVWAAFKGYTIIGTITRAVEGLTGATWGLNAAWTANPLGLIISGAIVLLGGFSFMVKKISGDILGWSDSFLVVGQTLNRLIGFFLNPIYDLVQSILALGSYLPGAVGKSFSSAWNNWENFQKGMNMKFTGSTDYGLFHLGDSYKMAMDRAKEAAGTTTGTGEGDTGVLGGVDNSMSELQRFLADWFKTFSEENKDTATTIAGLGGGPKINSGSPPLNFGAMGKYDLWGTVLRGF
ncbi:hypothetical protein LQZ19_05215 [Treponema primitia]|uniref:hypothetical protein n=1 Tax=Treponema primitia TaxID=88058 RepID=UPI00397F4CB3